MSRNVANIFVSPNRSIPTPDGVNHAGGPSYTRSLEEQCLQVLMTGVFQDTYYADQQTLVKEALTIFQQMALKDSVLFAKMIVFARNRGFIRTAPITALVVLSTADVVSFCQAFPQVVRTPNDLKDFVVVIRSRQLRQGMGRAVKRAIGDWLNNLSEYHAIKYGSKGSDWSLRDILRLVRPVPKDQRTSVLYNYLRDGLTTENSLGVKDLLPQVATVELLKDTTDAPTQLQLIAEGRLPYEVVVGAIKPRVEIWTALMEQMPIFALLRHLNTLNKAGVFNDRKAVTYVVGRLTDQKVIKNSKILPFQFFTAHNSLDTDVPRAISEAVETALEISFENVPMIPGRVCVGPDTSGSMGSQVSVQGKTRFIDIAAIFTAAMLRKTDDALILPFDTQVHACRLSSRDTLMTTARSLASHRGGGTNVGAPLELLLAKQIVVDVFIGVTDCESWHGRGFMPAWREYKKKVNPNAKAFLLTIAPYRHSVAPESEKDVYFIYGWSQNVLPYIAHTVSGGSTQLDAVRALNLAGKTATEGETGDE
jgi:60 kDa SS-A/Ro ribonucleoprotein